MNDRRKDKRREGGREGGRRLSVAVKVGIKGPRGRTKSVEVAKKSPSISEWGN